MKSFHTHTTIYRDPLQNNPNSVRYFLENSCGWILELDRGEGIPHEGNYSEWLAKKKKRMEEEKRQDERLKRTLESELEWVRSNPKARQTKSKARLDRYEEVNIIERVFTEMWLQTKS